MKKIFTLIASIAMIALSANAESWDTPAIDNAQYPHEVGSKTITVKVDFGTQVNIPEVAVIGGSWMNSTISDWKADDSEPEGLPLSVSVDNVNGVTFATIDITPDTWGNAAEGRYMVAIGFPGCTDVNGDLFECPVVGEDGIIVSGISAEPAIYLTIPDTTPATYLGSYPSQEEMEGLTVGDLYESGMIGFLFSNEVNYENAFGNIVYYAGGFDYDNFDFTAADIYADWTRDGKYMVAVFLPESTELTPEELDEITVEIDGITTLDGSPITVPTVDFENPTMRKSPRANQGMESKLNFVIENYEGLDVFSIGGSLIKKNASSSDIRNLTPGLYVIGGKKIAIR